MLLTLKEEAAQAVLHVDRNFCYRAFQNIYKTGAMIDLCNQRVSGEGDTAAGVKQQRYSETGAAIVTSKMKIDIAKNVTSAYVSTTPSYALGLLEALEVQILDGMILQLKIDQTYLVALMFCTHYKIYQEMKRII